MTRNIVGLLWIAISITNCPERELLRPTSVEAVQLSAAPPPGLQPYGVDGELSETDITRLLYLQFPQSYNAISNEFGFPAYRDSTTDYYKLPNGRWAAIRYVGAMWLPEIMAAKRGGNSGNYGHSLIEQIGVFCVKC